MYLFHYYDKRSGPFRSVTAVPLAEGIDVLRRILLERPDSMCAKRNPDYIEKKAQVRSSASGGIS